MAITTNLLIFFFFVASDKIYVILKFINLSMKMRRKVSATRIFREKKQLSNNKEKNKSKFMD